MGQENEKSFANTLLLGLVIIIVGLGSAFIISSPFRGLRNDVPQLIRGAIKSAKEEINIKDLVNEVYKSMKDEIDIKDLVEEVSKHLREQMIIQDIAEEINKEMKNKKITPQTK